MYLSLPYANVKHCGVIVSEVASVGSFLQTLSSRHFPLNSSALLRCGLNICSRKEIECGRTVGTRGGSNGVILVVLSAS